MTTWVLTCPNCGTENNVPATSVRVQCGRVSGRCTCVNCGTECVGEQAYWRWLGLDSEPPAEPDAERT